MLRLTTAICIVLISTVTHAQKGGGGGGGGGRGSTGGPVRTAGPSYGGGPILLGGGFNSFGNERQTPARRKGLKESDFTFHVTSNLVTVDLIATDKTGKIVTGLKPEDIEIFDDGKKQTISRMTLENRVVVKPSSGSAAASSKQDPGLYENYSIAQGWQGPVTILLMDAVNTPLAAQAYARYEMLKLLKELHPQQPVAIYTLGRRLTLLQDFTSDPHRLQDAAAHIKLQISGVTPGVDQEISAVDKAAFMTDDLYNTLVAFGQEDTASRIDDRVRMTGDAFRAIARHALGYPGRKNLIWLSSSFPLELMSDWQLPSTGNLRMYYQDLHDIGAMLSDANIAVYPVDAEGLRVRSNFNASGSGRVNNQVPNGQMLTQMMNHASFELQAVHETMGEIADQTGGRAFYNRNDLDAAIGAAIEDGSAYYAVAFVPQNYVPDGKLHDLKIKSKHSGLQLRYRRGYFAIDPYDPAHPSPERQKLMTAEMNDVLLGQQLSTGVALSARLTTDVQNAAFLALSPGTLSFVSDVDGKKRTAFEVVTATFDGKGKPLHSTSHSYTAHLNDAEFGKIQQTGFGEKLSFERTPESKRLRIAVRDLLNDRIGTVDVPLN